MNLDPIDKMNSLLPLNPLPKKTHRVKLQIEVVKIGEITYK